MGMQKQGGDYSSTPFVESTFHNLRLCFCQQTRKLKKRGEQIEWKELGLPDSGGETRIGGGNSEFLKAESSILNNERLRACFS